MPVQKITKEEIIRKSIEVFQQRGYNATSMNDLAQACGLLKGSFYHYFKSKEELMIAVLDAVRAYYRLKVFVIAFDDTMSPKDRMWKIFKKQEPIITQHFAGCLFGNITLETISLQSEFKETLKGFFSDWLQAFTHIFRVQYAPAPAAQLAWQAVMEIEGAIMMMRLYDDKSLLENACLRVLQSLDQPIINNTL